MRVVLYGRISTRDSGQDTENRLSQLRDFAKTLHWTIVNEYLDRPSGKHSDREQFKAMFDGASRREFDVVLAWALDRFSGKGVAETFRHIRVLLGYGVQFVSFTERNFRTTGPAGELMIALVAWIAQQERSRPSERTKAGLQSIRADRIALGRPRCLVDRAKVARMSAEGMSTREIGCELDISAASVCRILQRARASRLPAPRL